MAETAAQNDGEAPVADEPEEPHLVHLNSPGRSSADRSAREATELARLRSNYTRASSYRLQGSSIASTKPNGLLECFIYTIKAFWRRQISITVAHSTCRDHLGTSLLLNTLYLSIPSHSSYSSSHVPQVDSALCLCVLPDWELGRWWPASPLMQKVICCSYYSVSPSHVRVQLCWSRRSSPRRKSVV